MKRTFEAIDGADTKVLKNSQTHGYLISTYVFGMFSGCQHFESIQEAEEHLKFFGYIEK